MYSLKILSLLTIIFISFWACSLDNGVEDGGPNPSSVKLVINEYLASNDACCTDENGEYDDFFEIYNYDSVAINVGGMYISDSKNDYKQHQIPKDAASLTTIQPGGFLVIWCDGQPEQGALHAPFKLGSGGEDIVLVESDGRSVVSELSYPAQTTDISVGRMPDGSNNWQNFSSPTPGVSNNGSVSSFAPVIGSVTISPEKINAGEKVTLSADVTDDDGDLSNVALYFGTDKANLSKVDMTATASTYSVEIGPFNDAETVHYYISATDATAKTTNTDTLYFEVGYVPPVLFINEFLASNDACCTDEKGDYDDWIEIYNPGTKDIDIGGMYITDDLTDLTIWQIPATHPDSTTIPAGGYLVLWADKEPEQGILHVNVKLGSSGEQIALTAPNGTAVIDSLTYEAQTTDISYGRQPDGSNTWGTFTTPTPGASNN